MLQKDFDKIEKGDILSLIDDGVPESKTLDYKEMLPDKTQDAKQEFLADVSSFANASGGYLIFGMVEERDENDKKTGRPKEVRPIQGFTPDEVVLFMSQLLRDGIFPRLPIPIEPRAISGWGKDGNGFVIVLHIRKSFISPHMVKLRKSQRFYSRTSSGKYLLDIQEIRAAFLATDSQVERVKRFRQDRISQIASDETPVVLSAPQRFVVHIIPIEPFLNDDRLDIRGLDDKRSRLWPMMPGNTIGRYNIDGFLMFGSNERIVQSPHSYCQLFWHGTIEATLADIVDEGIGVNVIPVGYIANRLEESLPRYLDVLKSLGVVPPVNISAALIECKGLTVKPRPRYCDPQDCHPIDRDILILPNVTLESFDADVMALVRPIFDAMWNAGGLSQSPYYDADGKWVGVR
jgi:hypothetical protein